jgi:diguanylate cyclase (GGDEF)-like protein
LTRIVLKDRGGLVEALVKVNARVRRPVSGVTLLMSRLKLLPPVVVLMLTLGAFVAVVLLMSNADAGRREQLRTTSSTLALTDLQAAPFNADPSAGGSPVQIRREIAADERTIAGGLMRVSQSGTPSGLLATGRRRLAGIEPVVMDIFRLATSRGGLNGPTVPGLQERLTVRSASLSRVLASISRHDALRAQRARREAELGTATALLLLFAVFMFFYFRLVRTRVLVERLARQNDRLLYTSRQEATTDVLTGLGNRRALEADLARRLREPAGRAELLLAMFDLDGFKQYNDSYGHAAGDALLQRLGARLGAVGQQAASTYRMGGDEFCLLCRCTPADAEDMLAAAVGALTDTGEGWHIGCSYGAAWIPSEAADQSGALGIADQRMYANKQGRASASRQLTDVLLQVITEQDAHLDQHVEHVARLATRVAEQLKQPEHEVQRIRLAATLHDIGKTAIPSDILNKPGPLTPAEWEFVQRHTLIGERIVLAAPALANTAPLVRSSHERIDGTGYPDGLKGDQIPLGSRIIAVCDAFDAMTSGRPYSHTTTQAAIEELQRCKGTQFDPHVTDIFCQVLSSPTAPVSQERGIPATDPEPSSRRLQLSR